MKKTQKKEDDPKLNWKQNVVLYLHDLLHMMLFMIAVFLITDFSDLTDLYSWLQNQKIRKIRKIRNH